MNIKRIAAGLLVLILALSVASCKKTEQKGMFETVSLHEDDEKDKKDDGGNTTDITSADYTTVTGTFTFAKLGQVKFEVYPQVAPQSALNFLYLAQNECFNGVIVDRVQKGFTIELGRYLQNYVEAEMPGGEYTIKGEFANNNIDNPLAIAEGAICWCRDYDDPDSAKNEFMICLDTAGCQSLQGDYAVFGMITDGMDIIKKIGSRKTYKNMRPKNPPLLLTVEIDSELKFPEPERLGGKG